MQDRLVAYTVYYGTQGRIAMVDAVKCDASGATSLTPSRCRDMILAPQSAPALVTAPSPAAEQPDELQREFD